MPHVSVRAFLPALIALLACASLAWGQAKLPDEFLKQPEPAAKPKPAKPKAATTTQNQPAVPVIKYYKYGPEDINQFIVFKSELAGKSQNNGTCYEVEFDSNNRPKAWSRFIRSELMYRWERTYDERGLITQEMKYSPLTGLGTPIRVQKYTWDGNKLTQIDVYDSQGGKTGYVIITSSGNETTHTWYNASGARNQWYIYKDNAQHIPTEIIWNVSDVKRYEQTIDQETGLLMRSKGFIDGKFNFTQVFTYNAEGIRTEIHSSDVDGRHYSSSSHDKYGNRTTEDYNFKNGTTRQYTHEYDSRGNVTKSTITANGKLACTLRYNRKSNGAVTGTDLYDTKGELIATYPGVFVKYIGPDGKDTEGRAGNIHKKFKLW
ncbi:hypothetical protein NNJEOMEG_03823 [Fundidesulfovibrio magnetotacticus]|uniref:Rhs family protein n=1 Tax=Fundidesulfovibrio magnetotacticus TaxID=2730080 RepID=A0A6V8LYS8_9BACT|nr:hypothetical protein [Fundidesulfovibrio magnetotacticus]GFK95950.1 hypothetical protein NNJEOMEG_03823 [Fundidesulfovibrio magnetotacticus]